MIAQMSSRYVVLMNFELNKDYIVKNLCENRSKPKSCCKGKCFLKKQLQKADKEENIPAGKSSRNKNEEIFCSSIKKITSIILPLVQENKYTVTCDNFIFNKYPASIFHPPQV
jgi:hypothetical protein